MRITILGASALSAALALTVATLAPASANSIGVRDLQDIDHGVDLRSVVVDHNEHAVTVSTTHVNIRPSFRTGAAGAVYIDTDPADAGPEYVFVGGYYSGTEYHLYETSGFGVGYWGEPVDGSYAMRLDYNKEQVRMRIARAALGSPDQVRVAIRVAGTRRDGSSRGLVDWLGEPRSFTEWVAQ